MVRQQANSMVTHLLLPLPPPPPPIDDFMFDSTHTSPLNTAPSSPKNFASFHPNEDAQQQEEIDIDFAFDFSGQLVPPPISDADELFDCGKIKTLDPLPPQTKPKSPKFTQTFHRAKKDKNFTETPKHKVSRSLSPKRASNIKTNDHQITTTQTSSLFGFTWHNKWNLKNLLLFRSTSAGSAEITKDVKNNSNNTSFRSIDGSVSGSSRRRMKRKVSAHEIHYTANRAVAEERRRKTITTRKWTFSDRISDGYLSVANYRPYSIKTATNVLFRLTCDGFPRDSTVVGNPSVIYITYRRISDAIPTSIFIRL